MGLFPKLLEKALRVLRVKHSLSCFFSLFQGDIGPFSPSLPIDIPLWMAINLKQRQKARIRPPDWMEVGRILFTRLTQDLIYYYNKTCVKRPLKNRQNNDLNDKW